MVHIGHFIRNGDGYLGRLRTLTLDVEIAIVPAEHSDSDDAPDYRIHRGSNDEGPDIGAAWKRTGEKAGDYVSVLIDDPSLAQPINANLFQSARDGAGFNLTWNRARDAETEPEKATSGGKIGT